MNQRRSPLSGALHIDCIDLGGGCGAGTLGLTHCPGRSTTDARGRPWQRDLDRDVEAIRREGFRTVVTLLDDGELMALGAANLGTRLHDAGVRWVQFPIADFGVPAPHQHAALGDMIADVVARLRGGEQVLVHCAAGLGRTGTIAAIVLKAFGEDGESAIARIRSARPGTVETPAQHAFVIEFGTSAEPLRRG